MKLLIDIQGNKPLSSYGDNHIIAYNSETKNYYVTTADSFFAGQNAKIKKMAEDYAAANIRMVALQEELGKFEQILKNRMQNFEENINNKMTDFLKQYQDTNTRLIALVRELIENKEEE